jgi:hypothetical protein
MESNATMAPMTATNIRNNNDNSTDNKNNDDNRILNNLHPSMNTHKEDRDRHKEDRDRLFSDVPDDYGLLITIEADTCLMEYVPDEHLPDIHPNAYGPACLSELSKLGGGGSGVKVFKGSHPRLGSLVMKHGGYTDTKDLFGKMT